MIFLFKLLKMGSCLFVKNKSYISQHVRTFLRFHYPTPKHGSWSCAASRLLVDFWYTTEEAFILIGQTRKGQETHQEKRRRFVLLTLLHSSKEIHSLAFTLKEEKFFRL